MEQTKWYESCWNRIDNNENVSEIALNRIEKKQWKCNWKDRNIISIMELNSIQLKWIKILFKSKD